jgi:hypothetical protein
MTKEIPNIKFPEGGTGEYWNVELGVCLGFESWNLEVSSFDLA